MQLKKKEGKKFTEAAKLWRKGKYLLRFYFFRDTDDSKFFSSQGSNMEA